MQRRIALCLFILLCALPVQAQRRLTDFMATAIENFMDRDYTGALNELNQAIQRYPTAGVAYNWRGYMHFLLKNLDAAYSDQTDAINRGISFAYIDRALVSASQGEIEAALKDYRTGILANRAYDFPADLTDKQPDFSFIALAYTRALEVDPNNYIALVMRGNAYANLSLFEQAAADYQQAKVLAPDFELIDYSIAELQNQQVTATCTLQSGETAQRLLLETAMQDTLDNTNFTDYWCFAVGKAPALVTIGMNKLDGDLDPLLILYALGAEDRPLARHDNISSDNPNALLTYRLRLDGTFVVAATRARIQNGTTTGSYSLTLTIDQLGNLSWRSWLDWLL